jgi:hypothetical protein
MTRLVKPQVFSVALLALLTVTSWAAADRALAQNGQPAAESSPPPAAPAPPISPAPGGAAPAIPPQPPPAEKPGFFHQMKDWWDNSLAVFSAKGKDTSAAVGDLNKKMDDAAKSAADAAKSTATATQDAVNNAVEATKGAATTATDAMKNAVEATKNAAGAIARLPGTRIIDIHETCAKAANGASDCAAAAANGCRGKGFTGGNPLDVRSAQKCDTKPLQAGNLSAPVACGTETVVIRAMCQ